MATNTDADARTADEKRDARAKWESFSYEVPAPGTALVRNHSHGDDVADEHEYHVDVRNGSATECECPDHQKRGVRCKHMKAVDANDAVRMAADVADPDAEHADAQRTGDVFDGDRHAAMM